MSYNILAVKNVRKNMINEENISSLGIEYRSNLVVNLILRYKEYNFNIYFLIKYVLHN